MGNKIIKVIYFDEETAIDYITIADGGSFIKNLEQLDKDQQEAYVKGEAGAGLNISFLKWFKVKANLETGANIKGYGENVIKSTLTNTILTDYIEKAEKDDDIKKFENYNVVPIKDSLSFFKMYTPYTVLFKEEFHNKISPDVDLTKLDKVLNDVKGYYEFCGVKSEDEKVILRFNLNGFRNNYKISNLSNMNLILYGVLVGYSTLEQYAVENEFNFNESGFSIEEMKTGKQEEGKKKLPIYDVVLAGIVNEPKKEN